MKTIVNVYVYVCKKDKELIYRIYPYYSPQPQELFRLSNILVSKNKRINYERLLRIHKNRIVTVIKEEPEKFKIPNWIETFLYELSL